MRYLFLLGCISLLAACDTAGPPAAARADVLRSSFPDSLTSEEIYLGEQRLPPGTRFRKQVLPTGQRLVITLPQGQELEMPTATGELRRTARVCYACECFDPQGRCEVVLYNVRGGQLGFLPGSCSAEVVGWFCDAE